MDCPTEEELYDHVTIEEDPDVQAHLKRCRACSSKVEVMQIHELQGIHPDFSKS